MDYAGSNVFGAFSSREKAQEVFDSYQAKVKAKNALGDYNDWLYDECEILEVELDVSKF